MRLGHNEVLRHAVTLEQVHGKVVARPRIPLVGRILKKRGGARRIARYALPGIAHQRKSSLGLRVALGCRFIIQRSRGRQIDLDSKAVGVNDAESKLACRIALFGGSRVPAPRLCVIDLAAKPASVHQGERCLRRRDALLGREATPAQGFGGIGRDFDPVGKHQLAIAVGDVFVDRGGLAVPFGGAAIGLAAMQIGKAQLVLRLAVALLRRPPEPRDGVAQVADNAFAARIHETQPVLAFGVAGRGRFCEIFECLGGLSAGAGGERGSDQAAGRAGRSGSDGRRCVRAHASPRSFPARHH
jgi:hypothetical protein